MVVACGRSRSVGLDAGAPRAGDDAAAAAAADAVVRHDLEGRVTVDGIPQGGTTVVIAGPSGRAVAETTAGHDGRFGFDRAQLEGDGERWVVAKLADPVVGAVAAPVSATSPVELAVTPAQTVMLDVVIEFPPKADVGFSVDVDVDANKLDGVPDAATKALPFASTGTSVGEYVHTRVATSHRLLRVMRGSYSVSASSYVEWGLTRDPHPPNWMTDRAILPDGSVVRTRSGAVHLTLEHDTVVRLIMVPDYSDEPWRRPQPPPRSPKHRGAPRPR